MALASIPSEAYIAEQLSARLGVMPPEAQEQTIIATLVSQSGMDEASVAGIVSEMTDEEKNTYISQILTAQITFEYAESIKAEFGAMTMDQLSSKFDETSYTETQLAFLYDKFMPLTVSDLHKLGYVDRTSPNTINIFAQTFEDKDVISELIGDYNEKVSEENQISYTDYVALLMSSITTIISAISYVLIAFVAISLVVSSIMIGIITYISVLERTKEIGILRSIGASKRDISRVFNAETLIVGFSSGAIGIAVTLVFNIIINIILHALTGIPSLNAVLPVGGALILVGLSMGLTLVAGLIPSRIAAKKDPVVALRTE